MMPAPAKAPTPLPEPVKEEEGGTDVTVSIIPGSGANYSLISICPPTGAKRTPSDICCVIDISWSMTMEATVQAAGGKSESNGLSMLDIAKHAVRTVMHSLGPEDCLSLVEFCRESRIVLPLTKMDQDGVRLAEESLEGIGYGNGTSLSRGLQLGLQALEQPEDSPARRDRLAHMMVLTDGETESKELVMPLLTSYATEHGQLPCTIHCFGFGYEIDSALLMEIATVGSGSYAFIPDAGFVGTVFVNCMSNLLVTMATDMKLILQGIPSLKVLGSWEPLPPDGGPQEVMIGTLQYGQSRELVCRHDGADASKLSVQLEYRSAQGTKSSVRGVAASPDGKQLEIHRCRAEFLDTLKQAIEVATGKVTAGSKEAKIIQPDLAKAQSLLKDIGSKVASSSVKDEEQVKGLLEDICGQTAEAFSSAEYWEKWGRHYAPSLHCAHQRQLCNNFKDPGVQIYGGDLFLDVRDGADEEFNKLPPPNVTHGQYKYLGKGKIVVNTNFGLGGTGQPARTPVSMAAYNDRYGGCIDGSCFIETPIGKSKRIADLVKGDRVSAHGGAEAEVVCVVASRCVGQKALLVELPGGARLTPHHPVCIEGEWRFPANLGAVVERPCEAVYSFILRGSTNLIVGGVPCIALGHGLEEGAARHPYFGTKRVIKDLSTMRGFDTGHIELKQGAFHRNPDSGIVCGVSPEP